MTGEKRKEGTGETLRGAVVIVVAGVALGLAFNALGLASKPPRGLPWVKLVAKLPSLEELQGDSTGAVTNAPVPGGGRLAVSPAPVAATPATPAAGSRSDGAAASDPGARPAPAPPPDALPGAHEAATPSVTAPPPAAAGLPEVPDRNEPIEVQLSTAKRFFDAKAALFVDAREAPEYAEGRIPGALNLPLDDVVARPALLGALKDAGRPVIVYCGGGDCEVSKSLAWNMLDQGIRKVLVYTGGLEEWQAAGYPVERGPAKGGS